MSNDTVIFFDTDTAHDGMLLLWWDQGSDDDFLWGIGLAKKEKQAAKSVSSNEIDETAIAKKVEQAPPEEPIAEISSSIDALVIKKAEPIQRTNSWWNISKYTEGNNPQRGWRFSIATANKISFEQGKTSKKRIDGDIAENSDTVEEKTSDSFVYEKKVPAHELPQQNRRQSTAQKPVQSQSQAPAAYQSKWINATKVSSGNATREDRRKNATGQAVVFNRGGGGQRPWWGNFQHNSGGTKRPTHNIKSDYKVSQTISKKDEIHIGETITVKEFAEKMWVPIAEVIKKFIANKMLLSLNSSIDFEVATLIAMEFDIKVTKESANAWMQDLIEWNLQTILEADRQSETKEERPPIVTVMGHVDHGKTTLLDYLRKSLVAGKEHGGITQSIWWSQIIHNGKKVTFIDTPGHALFTSLRARGSKITDIVIIVIAADDGVMKQTVEAINHAKAANVPIIVAITKIDKGIDNTEFIKTQLSEHGLIAEDWGWDVPIVKLSSKTGQGIEDLMDQILLHAEVSELVCDPNRSGIWVVLEAYKDIQKGIIANMIVMTGTIKVGDIIWIYNTYGKVKKIYNRKGNEIKSAHGGDPVMILGINDVPEAGKLAESVKDEKEAKQKISTVLLLKPPVGINALLNKISEGEMTQANLLIKADSWWSLEALKAAISQIETPDNIMFKIVHDDIGNFFDSDLDLAKASDAILIGFGVSMSTMIKAKIDQMWISMKSFNIIYDITDYLEALVKGLIKYDPVEVVIGKLNILGVFFRKGNDTICGGRISEGENRNGAMFRLIRWDEIIDTGKITSLQKGQEHVDKLSAGYECGMKVRISKKIEINDVLELYVME